MAGMIHSLIDEIVQLRGGGNSGIGHFVRAQLLMKGIDPSRFDASSKDDPKIIATLTKMKHDFQNLGGPK